VPTLEWNAPMTYWSDGDERAFFVWLQSIAGVTGVEGKGSVLRIHLRSRRLSRTAQRELVAIYKRYGGDLRELTPFVDSR
jgi:hypothetical protein